MGIPVITMAVLGSITQNSPDASRHLVGRASAAVIACLTAVLLITLAVPRFLAAVSFFPFSERRGSAYHAGVSDSVRHKESFASHSRAAAYFFGDDRIYANLGLMELQLFAKKASEGERDAELLSKATNDLVKSIILAPANPYAWARLALVREFGGAPKESVVKALFTSVMEGPNEPELLDVRIRLAIDNWRDLTSDQRGQINNMIEYAMTHWPYQRILYALGHNSKALGIVRAALADDPKLLSTYDKELRRLLR